MRHLNKGDVLCVIADRSDWRLRDACACGAKMLRELCCYQRSKTWRVSFSYYNSLPKVYNLDHFDRPFRYGLGHSASVVLFVEQRPASLFLTTLSVTRQCIFASLRHKKRSRF